MKKVIITILAVALVASCALSLAACGNKSNTEYLFGKETIAVNAQMDIFTGMTNGSADIGVMDSIMAGYYMKSATYKDKMEMLPFYLSEEEYGIGAKKGSLALMEKINEGLIEVAKSGMMQNLGTQFGVASDILVKADTKNPITTATDDSWSKIVASKKIIIGYTVFAPIAYEENNKLTGYDIELAKEVVTYLNDAYAAEIGDDNIEIEFQVIDWDQKEVLLKNGGIDLVWNGMTINDERKEGMCLSIPYLANKQAIVIKKADKGDYKLTDLEAFKASASDKIIYVESGSAAEDLMIIKK